MERKEKITTLYRLFMTIAALLFVIAGFLVYLKYSRETVTLDEAKGLVETRKLELNAELAAVLKINQEFGLIMTASDGKRYCSFAYRANQQSKYPQEIRESREFLLALSSLKDIKDLRGVHLDGLNITSASLDRIADMLTLERLTVRQTTLTQADIGKFKQQRPNVEVWDTYDALHP